MRRISWLVAQVAVLICFASVSIAQVKAKHEELPNFHQVNENLFRGAQPKQNGIQRLAALGIKTIVNLRDDDQHAGAEEIDARAAGLRYFNVPIGKVGRPAEERIARVLAIINAPENQPVFVHCRRGADRTGTVIAIYRIEHYGWTSEKAKSEASHYGMALWQISMKNYIDDYYKRRLRPRDTRLAPGAAY